MLRIHLYIRRNRFAIISAREGTLVAVSQPAPDFPVPRGEEGVGFSRNDFLYAPPSHGFSPVPCPAFAISAFYEPLAR